jgi:hypothetical protein
VRRIVGTLAVAVVLPLAGTTAGATVQRPILIRHFSHGSATSTNWSGYATFGGGNTFTDVKGNWIQPTAHCNTRGARYSSFWVGIDGYTSNSVQQIGTEANCNGKNNPEYYAWWEMFPDPSNRISGVSVHPGDSISAEVSASGTTYTLKITNNSTGQSFTTQQNASAANANAEWVAEAPSLCFLACSVQKLTNFGTVNFTGSYTTGNGHTGSISDAAWSNDKITMVTNGGRVKAQPSALSPDGTAFSVTWKHA